MDTYIGHLLKDHQDASTVVEQAQKALRRGDNRDDVYHEVVRFAAINGLNRYSLWQTVQEGQ